jgi:hypothetical protein
VSGTFTLRQHFFIDQPNITIDGSTAPNGGVQFRGPSLWVILADEVIIRHVRLRPGPDPTGDLMSIDCLLIKNGRNIVIDHVSCTWATDENISMYASEPHGRHRIRNVTIQHSLIGEALYCSKWSKQDCRSRGQSMGALFTGDLDGITLYRNLFAHNVSRNPAMGPGRRSDGSPLTGMTRFELIQNVVYDYVYGVQLNPGSPTWLLAVDAIGNYFKWGANPDRFRTAPKVPIELAPHGGRWEEAGRLALYLEDNFSPRRQSTDPQCGVFYRVGSDERCTHDPSTIPHEIQAHRLTTHRFESLDQSEILPVVVTTVGANLPCSDAVDRRIVRDTVNGTGSWINDPEDVGGWANLEKPCNHINAPPAAGDVTVSAVKGKKVLWTPEVTDSDSAPLTSLRCDTPIEQKQISVANDCSKGGITTDELPPGNHVFAYTVSDGSDVGRGTVTLKLTEPSP